MVVMMVVVVVVVYLYDTAARRWWSDCYIIVESDEVGNLIEQGRHDQ